MLAETEPCKSEHFYALRLGGVAAEKREEDEPRPSRQSVRHIYVDYSASYRFARHDGKASRNFSGFLSSNVR
jgi:hypothetical protein